MCRGLGDTCEGRKPVHVRHDIDQAPAHSFMIGVLSMDFTNIAQLIGSLGFPIVCTIVCFWYIFKNGEAQRELIQKMQDSHKAEIEKLRETIDNNTQVMIKIYERVGKDD